MLVLQGGGALGAYQAGVYQAIQEAEHRCRLDLRHLDRRHQRGGYSPATGRKRRLERLREFWDTVTTPPMRLPNIPWFTELPWSGNGHARYWTNRMSAFSTMFHGAPGFFTPRPFPPMSSAAERPDQVSYYDTSPLQATLGAAGRFRSDQRRSRCAFPSPRPTCAPARRFISTICEQTLGAAHMMASASLPPGFPPTEIDGEYYWDGGVVSNSPMQFVIDDRPRYSALVFQVDLWDANGEVPLDIPSANLRALEIHSASRLNITLRAIQRTQKFRHGGARGFLDELPAHCQNDPDMQFLSEEARGEGRDRRATEIPGQRI